MHSVGSCKHRLAYEWLGCINHDDAGRGVYWSDPERYYLKMTWPHGWKLASKANEGEGRMTEQSHSQSRAWMSAIAITGHSTKNLPNGRFTFETEYLAMGTRR